MKITFKQLLVLSACVALLFSLNEALAQPNMGNIDNAITTSTGNIIRWGNRIIGAVVIIGSIYSTYALISGNPQAKNYVLGFFAAAIMWVIANMVIA